MNANGISAKMAIVKEVDAYLKDKDFKINSDQDRLYHLWLLFQESKNELEAALENIDILRSQFNDEKKDFEGYVEHITKLSDERETRALECEAENQDLKEQVQQLKLQLASFDNTETRDMLLQAGLDDIIHVRPSAQIAYLLVQRARLMDILEDLQNAGSYDAADGAKQLNNKFINRRKENYERSPLMEGRLGTSGGMKLPLTIDGDEINETSWCKLKDLLDKVDDLETSNEYLTQRLKDLAPEEYEQFISSQTQNAINGGVNSTAKPKMSDFVPKKPFVPPKDLQEAITRLEEKEGEVEFLRQAMRERTLEQTVNDEESFASLLGSPRGGLGTREIERHSTEIQNAMSAVDNHLQHLIQNSGGTSDNLHPHSSKDMASRLSIVQQEFERVKDELKKMMEKYRVQYRKYADHKLAVKNRMHTLKESFRQERLKLTEEIENLQNDLRLVKVTLQKEMEYKEEMETSHHTLLVEQQDLQIKLSQQEDLVHEKSRELAKAKVQNQCLEDEISELRQRLDGHGKQKSVFRIITSSTQDMSSA